jgi:hypothetical protein
MKLWHKAPSTEAGHEFVIGPPDRPTEYPRGTKVYHCMRCKESYLVCGRQVAVLDDDGRPISVVHSRERLKNFVESRCDGAPEVVAQPIATAVPVLPARHSSDEPRVLRVNFGAAPVTRSASMLRASRQN